jgi:thiol:disulfide interchange protein DsbD
MTHSHTPKPARFALPRAMIVAAALSAAFLGADTLAQKGKDTMAVSPFDSEAVPQDGNEVVDVRIDAHLWPPTPPERKSTKLPNDIEPGWHLYWKNNGDTGMPIMLKLTLPEGVTAGEILWPTPKRYEHSGGLLDYTYDCSVTIFIPLSGVKKDQPVSVKADIEFLVCKEACIPGVKTIQQTVEWWTPSGSSSLKDLPDFPSIARLPGSAGDAVCWTWDGTTLVFTANEAEEAETMIFFPEAGENLRPVNALRDGIAQGDTLRFAYRDAVRKADTVRGVLEIRNRSGQAAFYEVEAPAPK